MAIVTRLLVLALALLAVSGLRIHRGRPVRKHGMLGLPAVTKSLAASGDEEVKEKWLEQRLDHFDPTNTATWKQRYFINFKYFNASSNSPIFFQLGGEGEANPIWLKVGQVATNYAKHFHALQVMIEHRYYGKSHPTEDMSTKNLRYLTSEQALQDAAALIEHLREEYGLYKNKWVVFGGSYSGSLAAWFRLKYPHLAIGAIASSAPVKALLDFKQYIQVVEHSLGAQCVEEIRGATQQLKSLLASQAGWQEIEKRFKLCDSLNGNNQLDVSNLMSTLAGNFEGVVQYNKDNRAFEGAPGTNITIDTICSIMTTVEGNATSIDRYAKVNDVLLNAYSTKCLDFKYSNFLKEMKMINFDNPTSGARQWTYQTCTEFGFFQSSDLAGQPFGPYFPVKFFIEQCVDIFGPKFNENFIQNGIDFSNNFYGGLNLTLSNVVFPNGLVDPWHALGVLKDLSPTAIALPIKETAHCADMYPSSDQDPASLKEAREKIKQAIATFLQ